MRIRDRRRKKPLTLVITSASCLLILMTVGYAAFSTHLDITAKGNVVKNPLAGPTDEVITNLVETNPDELYTDDNNNIRYYGQDPNNYVYFDCTDKNNQTSDTCELWRIMGIIDGKVKLIRNESLTPVTTDTQNGVSVTVGTNSGFYWNQVQQEGKNYNNWEGSTLQNYLNGTYYSDISEDYQTMIDESTFYLGGATSSNYQTLTAKGYYDAERDGTQVYSGNPASIEQHIGLMYPSDYGYAAGSSCLSTALFSYDGYNGAPQCMNSDYLFSGKTEWLQAPLASFSILAAILNGTGFVYGYGSHVGYYSHAVRPVLYLTSQTQIVTGKGTIDEPFELG